MADPTTDEYPDITDWDKDVLESVIAAVFGKMLVVMSGKLRGEPATFLTVMLRNPDGSADVYPIAMILSEEEGDHIALPGAEDNPPPCDGKHPHTGPWTRLEGYDQAERCGCGFVSGK